MAFWVGCQLFLVVLAACITYSRMLKRKNEAWRQQFRKLHRESIKRTIRERHLLLTTLHEQLAHFHKCSLAGGEQESLGHTCYFHCQQFVGDTCHELYRSIAAVGTEHCKALLIERGLPTRLAMILEAVQNKTVVNDQLEMGKQCYSRLQLEEAVTKLVSLFTEDEELLLRFGDDAADLIFTALKFRVNIEDDSLNFIHGLHNLFLYDSTKAHTYAQLHSNNFEPLVWRHLMLIVDNRLVQGTIQTSMLALTRIYLRFQQEETEDKPHKMVGNAVSHLASRLFAPENLQFLDGFDEEFQEEFLKLISMFDFPKETAMMVLHCMPLIKYLPYAELFNQCSYDFNINIHDFSEMEVSRMMGMEGVKEFDRPRYEKLMAGTIVNMLLDTADSQQGVAMVWRCLERTEMWEQWLNREDHQCFKHLRGLLNTAPLYSL